MKKSSFLLVTIGLIVFSLNACGPKPNMARPKPVDRPCWSDSHARNAITALADQYRKDPEKFYSARTYVWAGTWIWPETVGISNRHLKLLKKMFYGGDPATREVVLDIIFMNIPAKKLAAKNDKFLKDLVLLDTELKESRANVPPPSNNEGIIEEQVQPQ